MLDDQALRDLLKKVKGYKEDREPIITCKPSGAKIILPKQEDSTRYKQSHVETALLILVEEAVPKKPFYQTLHKHPKFVRK